MLTFPSVVYNFISLTIANFLISISDYAINEPD